METAKQQLDRLLSTAPKREHFPSEEAFQEATLQFRHSRGSSIAILQSAVNREQSKSQGTAT